MNYKAVKNKITYQGTKRGLRIPIKPITEYSVVGMPGKLIVAHIPGYHTNAKGIANVIAKLLNNNRKFKFELDK